MQQAGKNTLIIDFESNYITDCQGMQYFKDDADGEEYVYTELEPDYCHIVFPCFDQPDLKAPQKMMILATEDWTVISNAAEISATKNGDEKEFNLALKRFVVDADSNIVQSFGDQKVVAHEFARTKPISTYLYCVVAGSFDALEPDEDKKDPRIPMRLFCRKSLTKYT